jgi:hypothetical protein
MMATCCRPFDTTIEAVARATSARTRHGSHRGRQPASTQWLTKFRHWLRIPETVVSSRCGCIRRRFCSSASKYRKLNVAGLLRAGCCAFSLSSLTGPGRSSISSISLLRNWHASRSFSNNAQSLLTE